MGAIGIIVVAFVGGFLGFVTWGSGVASAFAPHAPIRIDGDAGFTMDNGITGGNGTPQNPYIIEGWEIDAFVANGIDIRNTDAHFIIRSVYVHSGGSINGGIVIASVANGSIENATVSWNERGIVLTSSTNVTLMSNHASHNDAAIVLDSSANVTLAYNNVSNNGGGIFIGHSAHVTVASNDVFNNDGHGIGLWYAAHATLTSNDVSNDDSGIYLSSSTNITVTSNDAFNNGVGIDLLSSTNVTIVSNNASNNSWGIVLRVSADSTITSNKVSSNDRGIYLYFSTNVVAHHNNLIHNYVQAWDDRGYGNRWDDAYPSGGDYWSDYTGTDSCSGSNQDVCPDPDGVGDTPYTASPGVVGWYPLMAPFVVAGSLPLGVAITAPRNGQAFAASLITVTGFAWDTGGSGLDRVEVRVNGGAWATATGASSWALSVSLTPGSNTIATRALDNAGNPSAIDSVAVTFIPPAPPPVTTLDEALNGDGVLLVDGGSTVSNAVTFSFSATDSNLVAGFTCALDGVPSSCSSPASYAGLSPGPHRFEVYAYDALGRHGDPVPTFGWTILTPAEAVHSLTQKVLSLGLSSGTTNSLLDPLHVADNFLSNDRPSDDWKACRQLRSFIDQVGLYELKARLPSEQARSLELDATEILIALGCA